MSQRSSQASLDRKNSQSSIKAAKILYEDQDTPVKSFTLAPRIKGGVMGTESRLKPLF